MALSTISLPAGPTSVPVALPHRISSAISPSRLRAAATPAFSLAATQAFSSPRLPCLFSASSTTIRVTPANPNTRGSRLLRACTTDGEDDVALPEIDDATSALPHSDSSASAVPEIIDAAASAHHDSDGAATTLPHSDSSATASAVPEIDDTVSDSASAAYALPCTAASCSASPHSCVTGCPNSQSAAAAATVKPSLLLWFLERVKEAFIEHSVLLESLATLLIGGHQTPYFKEAVARRIERSKHIPPWVLTVFTFGAAVVTLLYKAAKASKKLDGIVSHLTKKFEKLLESLDVKTRCDKLPEPREAKSQAKEQLILNSNLTCRATGR
ncbi:hypothetical protein E2562_004274 [Oryza meyeriana var. granulata]|uniref:Uncharacterized protein n=1 Tax=Oryza meyeriana var. granulata TaxID=110450 RepID=A0A6G1BRT0_9ORYZ|nr:hypothetical protein E2562_004274 [Oryza meyeriana var. granulata]